MRKRRAQVFRIDIRDRRLEGGRLSISSGTTHAPTYRRRESAVRRLIEEGAHDLIRMLRDRVIHISEVQAAVEEGNLNRLRTVASDAGEEAGGDDPGVLTLGAACERLMRTVEATRADGTIHQYRIVLDQMQAKFGEDKPIAEIGSGDLEEWIHGPQETTGGKPWSHAKQQLTIAIAGRLWNTTIKREEEVADRTGRPMRVRRNPVKNVELPTTRTRRVEFLRPAEWQTLISAAEGRAVAVLLGLGCLAGLRMGEAAHLRPGIDLVLDRDKPHIVVQPRDGESKWRPKTERSIRTVPIGPALRELIEEHIRLGYSGDRYLIRQPGKDQPIARQVLQLWTKAAFEAAGIRYGRNVGDGLTFHSLRHTFISWLVQSDVSLKKIEKLAGTSVQMILDVYGHLIDEDLERAVLIVDQKSGERVK